MQGIEQNEASVRFERAVVRDIAPAPAIVDYAKEYDIDLIVMGTQGRRGIRRLSPAPVFTVKAFGKTLVSSPAFSETTA